MTLAHVERRVRAGGGVRMPSDAVMLRETAHVLRIMDGVPGVLATLVCVRGDRGSRITSGGEALLVARILRSRADRRGDATWADMLGRCVTFRVVYESEAPDRSGGSARSGSQKAPSRRSLARTALRVASAAS